MLEDCYAIWIKMVQVNQMRKKNLIKHAKERTRRILLCWESYSTTSRANPRKYHVAFQHYSTSCKTKTLEAWRKIVKLWKLDDEEEERLSEIAKTHYKTFRKRKVINEWKDWLKYVVRPRKRKLLNVQAHINKMTMKQALSAWQCIMRIQWMMRIKMEEAIKYEKKWIYIRTISRYV